MASSSSSYQQNAAIVYLWLLFSCVQPIRLATQLTYKGLRLKTVVPVIDRLKCVAASLDIHGLENYLLMLLTEVEHIRQDQGSKRT